VIRKKTIMWFAKWFGGRSEVEVDADEPARFTAPPARAAQPSDTTNVRAKKTGSVKGFDPYNSGAFEKRSAWEKVSKR
jgi:hypothetical protein